MSCEWMKIKYNYSNYPTGNIITCMVSNHHLSFILHVITEVLQVSPTWRSYTCMARSYFLFDQLRHQLWYQDLCHMWDRKYSPFRNTWFLLTMGVYDTRIILGFSSWTDFWTVKFGLTGAGCVLLEASFNMYIFFQYFQYLFSLFTLPDPWYSWFYLWIHWEIQQFTP